MLKNDLSLANLSNDAVIEEVVRLAGAERKATAQLVTALAELDARRLYLAEGCSSMFTYCTSVLHLSEHAAYSRIEAARAGRRFPLILQLLVDGEVTVTTVGLLARLLTEENHREVLARAVHKSKREIEEMVARLRPLPDVRAMVRRAPVRNAPEPLLSPSPSSSARQLLAPDPDLVPEPHPVQSPAAAPPAVVAPLAPERYKVQLTVGRDTYDKLRRVQDLMRHSVPNGDPAVLFDRALTALLAELEKRKLASTTRPGSRRQPIDGSRHIPAAVKRAVWKRDEGQCAFKGTRGRCHERGSLEFHHVRPFASGGRAEESNIELRCRAHNQYEADLFFGTRLIARERLSVAYGGNSVRTELSVVGSPQSSAHVAYRSAVTDVVDSMRITCRPSHALSAR